MAHFKICMTLYVAWCNSLLLLLTPMGASLAGAAGDLVAGAAGGLVPRCGRRGHLQV